MIHRAKGHIFTLTFIILFYANHRRAEATSINYGVSQRPITDISQLMPTLCQNQSVICEGSFCIPGLRRCVCDLRLPVQFGRFCLRQVDIETKCFVSNQCNHTIKDAVCIDTNSNTVLDVESSRYKLEQWQQLNELRQASKSVLSNQEAAVKQRAAASTNSLYFKPMLVRDGRLDEELNSDPSTDVIISSYRNSPYEINYYTPELLHQNHTRRKTNSTNGADRMLDPASALGNPQFNTNGTQYDGSRATATSADGSSSVPDLANNIIQSVTGAESTTNSLASTTTAARLASEPDAGQGTSQASTTDGFGSSSQRNDLNDAKPATTTVASASQTSAPQAGAATTTASGGGELSKKKMIIKTPNWPPGVCSCPFGYMFDSMLRKCLALSLAESHCQSDNDCRQIRLTHCSSETKKCECDEPLVWNQTELTCQRPRPLSKGDIQATNQSGREATSAVGFLENLLPPLLLAKLVPDQTMLLMIFVFLVIICTLVLLRLIVKCFSPGNSALISPKNSKKRKGPAGEADGGGNINNLLVPKSPYATLRKPEYKQNTPLANFTQAARGRILNYDFEQDNPIPEARTPHSPQAGATYVAQREDQQQQHHHHYGTLEKAAGDTAIAAGTLARQKQANQHKSAQASGPGAAADGGASSGQAKKAAPDRPRADECLELNDNVSLGGQLDSESKSESVSAMAIPGPPPSQTPPYMLASAMKGQGSAIAAAAAAVANRRMQMAHKKGLAEAASSSVKVSNGTPVFL